MAGPKGAAAEVAWRRPRPSDMLPDLEYPSPFVVRNTFIDEELKRPASLLGFFRERDVHSSPTSAVETDAWVPQPLSLDPVALLKSQLERLTEADGSNSCRSTSAGSSSSRSSSTDGRGHLTPPGELDTPACTSGGRTPREVPPSGLPRNPSREDSPISVKNTFVHFSPSQPESLVGFFEERLSHSCPASLVCPPEDTAEAAPEAQDQPWEPLVAVAAAEGWLEQETCKGGQGMAPGTRARMLTSEVTVPLAAAELPPPPAELPPLLTAPLLPAAPPQRAPEPPVLLLWQALETANPGVPAALMVGSAQHFEGTCKPCAHAHSARGCMNGAACAFCHLCPPGELKRRQKEKRAARRQATLTNTRSAATSP